MLISKRSPRKSKQFEGRFRDGAGTDFPVRKYLRYREDFFNGLVHAALTLAFLVTLGGFTRSLRDLFERHGGNLTPWYWRFTVGLMVLFMLSVLRRLYYKLYDLWGLKREMTRLKTEFRGEVRNRL